jgi:hypothetical protein
MTWSRRFRIRESVRGSLWVAPLAGAIAGALLGAVVEAIWGGSIDLDRTRVADRQGIGSPGS